VSFFESLHAYAGVGHILQLNKPAGRALIEFHQALLADVNSALVDPKMRPLLAYARKLTVSPARMTQADADAVFAAGWSERALHDAVLTVCLFNFMNRLLESHGCKGAPEIYATRGKALMDEGYAPLLKLLQ